MSELKKRLDNLFKQSRVTDEDFSWIKLSDKEKELMLFQAFSLIFLEGFPMKVCRKLSDVYSELPASLMRRSSLPQWEIGDRRFKLCQAEIDKKRKALEGISPDKWSLEDTLLLYYYDRLMLPTFSLYPDRAPDNEKDVVSRLLSSPWVKPIWNKYAPDDLKWTEENIDRRLSEMDQA